MLGRTTKTMTVSLPPEIMKEMERRARIERKSKSQLFRDMFAAYEEIQREKRWQNARAAGKRAFKRLNITSEEELDRIIHEVRGE
ncbi:MAG: ribbon-helix-helix protein, CopG family [Thermoleophilia bacterium]